MNCKPGDFARIISTASTREGGIADRFVTVTTLTLRSDDGRKPCWEYEGPRLYLADGRQINGISDDALRPIRDPGEDARDQTLDWLPVPSKEGETA